MRKPKVLFVSWHFYMDASNGASISARELLRALHTRGWNVRTFCGSAVDNFGTSNALDALGLHGIVPQERIRDNGLAPFLIYSFLDGDGFQSLLYRPACFEPIPQRLTGEIFLRFIEQTLKNFRPDIVITYGGYWLAPKILAIIRRFKAKSVVSVLEYRLGALIIHACYGNNDATQSLVTSVSQGGVFWGVSDDEYAPYPLSSNPTADHDPIAKYCGAVHVSTETTGTLYPVYSYKLGGKQKTKVIGKSYGEALINVPPSTDE